MMGKICPCQKMYFLTYKTVFLDMTKLRAMENVILQIDMIRILIHSLRKNTTLKPAQNSV